MKVSGSESKKEMRGRDKLVVIIPGVFVLFSRALKDGRLWKEGYGVMCYEKKRYATRSFVSAKYTRIGQNVANKLELASNAVLSRYTKSSIDIFLARRLHLIPSET